jgi:hypothetical protein
VQYVASARGRWKVVFQKRPQLPKAAEPFMGITLALGAIPFIPVPGMTQFYKIRVFAHVMYIFWHEEWMSIG